MVEKREIPKLTEAGKQLRQLKDEKDALEERLKEVNKSAKYLQERVIPKLMEDAEIENYKITGVGTVYVKQELYVSLTKTDDSPEPPFYDWARENAPDLIVPYIHPKRLQSYCNERLSQAMPLPDNMIQTTFVPTAKILRR
jgi:hypothetical protein